MLLLLAFGCLINQDLYEERLRELREEADDIRSDAETDADADGYVAVSDGGDDCDDANASVHPDATETPYDGVDQDCSGADDDDLDGDGYAGGTAGTDCDDASPSVHPDAEDRCYDGVDADCAGDDDDDCDADGHAAAAAGGGDCADSDPSSFPGAAEGWHDLRVDNDCDGSVADPVDTSLAAADVRLLGAGDVGWLGYRAGALPDIDGDGLEEIWALAPYTAEPEAFAGAVVLFRSTAFGLGEAAVDADTPRLTGPEGGYILGAAGTSADLDGDGQPELLATAAVAGDGTGVVLGWDAGVLRTLAGRDDAVSRATFTVSGAPGEYFGTGMASGDLDGDGLDDLLVDADGSSSVYAFLQPESGATSAGATARFTCETTPIDARILGDVDGDGYSDFTISRESAGDADIGAAVYSGAGGLASASFPDGAFLSFLGPVRVATYATVSGDATLLLVGAGASAFVDPAANGTYAASDASWRLTTEHWIQQAAYVEWYASGATGFLLAFADPTAGEAGTGLLWETEAWTASATEADILVRLSGARAGDRAFDGFQVIQDRDGDGENELLIGAPQVDGAGPDLGAVYIQLSP